MVNRHEYSNNCLHHYYFGFLDKKPADEDDITSAAWECGGNVPTTPECPVRDSPLSFQVRTLTVRRHDESLISGLDTRYVYMTGDIQ